MDGVDVCYIFRFEILKFFELFLSLNKFLVSINISYLIFSSLKVFV